MTYGRRKITPGGNFNPEPSPESPQWVTDAVADMRCPIYASAPRREPATCRVWCAIPDNAAADAEYDRQASAVADTIAIGNFARGRAHNRFRPHSAPVR